jgi:DNA-binding transcriptional regulator YiaG
MEDTLAMPNIASVLKAEIVRVARKEVRSETDGLRKASAAFRAEIAALKRRTQNLEQELRRLGQALPKPAAKVEPADSGRKARFSAKGLVTLRKRLGLSADDFGLLVGASGQSIYNWEAGSARPRDAYLPLIATLRTIGKKEAAARLSAAADARK